MFSTVMRCASERVRSASERLRMPSAVLQLKIDAIEPNPSQPRKNFDEAEMMSLAASVRQNGILQPLSVRRDEQGRYILIAGERRLRAARLAGLTRVPCIVLQTDERQAAVLAMMENLQREDLSCFEEAEGIQRLIDMGGLTREEVALRLGKAQSTLANKLRLLQLHPWQRKRIEAAGLCERHARALLRLEPGRREEALNAMIAGQMTVGEADALVAKMLEPPPAAPKRSPIFRDLRLFVNTINHAVDTMRRSGVNARADKQESERFIEYHIVIPKPVEEVPSPSNTRVERGAPSSGTGRNPSRHVPAREAAAFMPPESMEVESKPLPGAPKTSQPMTECDPITTMDKGLAISSNSKTPEIEAGAWTSSQAGPPKAPASEVTDETNRTTDDPEPTDWEGVGAAERIPEGTPPLYVITGRLGGWDEAAPAPLRPDPPKADRPVGGQGKSSLEALLRKVAAARVREKDKKHLAARSPRSEEESGQTLLQGFAEYTKQG